MKSFTLILAAGISAIGCAAAAQAADLMVAEPAPAMIAAGGAFDGAFIGVFGGGSIGTLEFPVPTGTTGGFFPDLQPQGYLLGVDAGFNFSLGNGLVLGVVGDIAWADITDTFGVTTSGFTTTTDWVGSIRARAGFDAGNFMPYLTAGLAAAHNTVDLAGIGGIGPAPVPTTISSDATHVGWTVGAGVEFAATENISIDVAYRYSDFGTATYDVPTFAPLPGDPTTAEADFGLTSHQLTVGVHYGF